MTAIDIKLREALTNVKNSYDDFINSFCEELEGYQDVQERVLKYLSDNPDASTGEVIYEIEFNIAPELYAENDDDDYDEEEDEQYSTAT